MIKIGLTGGIGSGKTTVSDQFAELGIPVVDTDILARQVVTPGSAVLSQLTNRFGDQIIGSDGAVKNYATSFLRILISEWRWKR